MKSKLTLILLSFVLFLGANAQSITTLTLENVITLAVENNQTLMFSEYDRLAAHSNLKMSKQAFAPSVNGSVSNTYDFGNVLDNLSFSTTSNRVSLFARIDVNMTLFQGMKNWSNLRQNEANLKSIEYYWEDMKNDVMSNATLFFLQVLLDKENIKITDSRIKQFESQLEQNEKRYTAGIITEGAVLAIKAQLSGEKVNYINQTNQYNKDMLNLVQYLNLDPYQVYEIQEPETENVRIDGDQSPIAGIFEYAMANHPGIKSKEMSIIATEYSLKNSKASYYPTLSAGANMSSWYSSNNRSVIPTTDTLTSSFEIGPDTFDFSLPVSSFSQGDPLGFGSQLKNNITQTVSLNLSIPIYNKRQVKTAVEQTQLNLDRARLNYEIEKNTAVKEIQQAYLDVQAAQASYNAGKEQLESTSKNLNYAQKKMDSGLISFYEYLESINAKTQAEVSLNQSKYSYIFKLKVLDLYQGKPIKF